MSPTNSPENTTEPDAAVDEAPKKRRRRVVRDVVTPPEATAPVAEPAAAPPVVEAGPPAGPAAPEVAPDAAPEAAPAPRARRSRRVTRTVVLDETPAEEPAAPAAAPVEAQDVTPDDAATDEEDEAADATAAPATDPADPTPADPTPADPTPTDTTPEVADEPEASGVAEQAAEEAEERAPRKRRPSRRGTRGARGAAASEPNDDAPAAASTPDAAPVAAADPAAPLDVLAELGPVRTTEDAPARGRLATTALLFQAPDPTARPRRRRAQASGGSPEAISEAARHEAEEAAAAPVATAEPAPAAAEAADEGTSRGRRRRGGRGRKAAPDAAVEADGTTQDAGEDPAEDAPAAAGVGTRDDASQDAASDDAATDDTATDETTGDDDADDDATPRRRRRRGGRGRRGRTDQGGDEGADDASEDAASDEDAESDEGEQDASDDEQGGSSRRRRRRRRGARAEAGDEPRRRSSGDEVTALRGSTRLEAKRQRRREGRDAGRRRQIITEAEFLARRESVERSMVVREREGRTQIAVLEDGVLVEHYVSHQAQASMVGNVYLGRVQNVLPSMEAAFVDVGKGRNAVLYAGEVNWDAAGLEGQPRRIEQALKSGDAVLVQVTKDPIGHKGARLTSQITLAGRYLVYVPGGGMTGISRKLPDTERSRLKKILRDVVPDSAGVIVRTAAEGASEEELRADVARLQGQWEAIEKRRRTANAPALLQGEPDMAIRVVRDIFNDDFSSLVVQGDDAWTTISTYVGDLAPDLAARVEKWTGTQDVFSVHRVDEQLAKGMDRKVWLPSGGSLVIDRTEAMTVVDVNTGKFTGAGGTLEETVTRNNLEAAEEIVRQLRLRDIGGIIVIDFIDMVLESNRDLVLRRLVECLGRDRTKHQVAEVTSLGLVQMTRKRVGQGLVEAFSETCEHCHGRGFVVHADPVGKKGGGSSDAAAPQPAEQGESKRSRRKRGSAEQPAAPAAHPAVPVLPEAREAVKATLATIAAAAAHAHEHDHEHPDAAPADAVTSADAPAGTVGGGTGGAGTLDVLAELAGVTATETVTVVESATQLELHAVAPEVFEDAAGADGDDEVTAEVEADGAAGEPGEGAPGEPERV